MIGRIFFGISDPTGHTISLPASGLNTNYLGKPTHGEVHNTYLLNSLEAYVLHKIRLHQAKARQVMW